LLAGCVCSVLTLPAVCSCAEGQHASAFGSKEPSKAGNSASATGGAPAGSKSYQ